MAPVDWQLLPTIQPGNYILGMIVEFVASFLSLLLVIGAVRRYRLKKNPTTLKILFLFYGFSASAFFTALGKLLVVTEVLPYPVMEYELFIDGFALMIMVGVATTASFMFTIDVFFDLQPVKKKAVKVLFSCLVGLVLSLLVALKLAYFIAGPPLYDIGDFKLVAYPSIFGLYLFTSLLLASRAFKVAKGASGIDAITMKMLGMSGLFTTIYYILHAMDVLNAFGLDNLSPLYFIGWGLVIASIFVAYIGYFRPAWFVSRMEKK
jgi:hypothetical protein